MKEHPILFNAEMVRAILDGRKTQTRRVVKPVPDLSVLKDADIALEWRRCPILGPTHVPPEWGLYAESSKPESCPIYGYTCPYGVPGDRLWVREAFWTEPGEPCGHPGCERHITHPCESCGQIRGLRLAYRATDWKGWLEYETKPIKWRPSIHMPRWASRLNLIVTSVRVERVPEITTEDAWAEGAVTPTPDANDYPHLARRNFEQLWDSINEKRGFGWDKNPWVWVIEFEKEEG